MSEKEIKDLAREYAKSDEGIGKYDYLGNEYEAYLDGFEDAVRWLSNRYCIVEKSKVKEAMKYPQRHTVPIPRMLVSQVQGVKQVLIDLFGKELFTDTEQ